MDLQSSHYYEDEFNEIQGLMNDLSSNLVNTKIKKNCTVFTSRETYILTCTNEEFNVRLANMDADDLEKSKRVLENELSYIDKQLKDSLSAEEEILKNKKEIIWLRLSACIEQRELLKKQLSDKDFLSMLLTTTVADQKDKTTLNEISLNLEQNTKEGLLCSELKEMTEKSSATQMTDEQSVAISEKQISMDQISSEQIMNTETSNGIEAHKLMTEWNPIKLLEEIFSKYTLETKNKKEEISLKKKKMLNMQGYLEKLPMNQTKVKPFKGWKKRFFKISSGHLFYYENHNTNVQLGSIEVKQAEIVIEAEKTINIKSQINGESLSLRCSTQVETNDWFKILKLAQCIDEEEKKKDIVIIDIGSLVIKGGQIDSPEICFPAVVALKDLKGKYDDLSYVLQPENCIIGLEAFLPNNRANSKLIYPLKSDLTIDQFSIKVRFIPLIIEKVFQLLQTNPRNKTIIIVCPRYLTVSDKEYIVEFLFSQLEVGSVCMQEQALLSLYSYSATTGIIVDIGDHLDILPVVEGTIIQKGVTSLSSIGQQITASLKKLLSGEGYRFCSDIENYVVQYIKEQIAEVLLIPNDKIDTVLVDISKFNLPYNFKTLKVEESRFECVEGLFQPSLWGKDIPSLQVCLEKAIKACEIDDRKEISKNIFLSGGSSLIKGLGERLEKELQSLILSYVHVKESANTHRINAAYKGASVLSTLPNFQNLCITRNEWISEDISTLMKRWSV
ncbi:POTE ankyrin domain family member J isoform X1 [Hydra vulgaris]|uniref:POTE ankyrin domain family member J isoform X1 n=1 Tax=Hydra vulgaris TaxID=6087 RepID=UPI001F5FC0D6|nr:POTE ankyrin domain family member J [Hydra vulgaris]